VSEPRDTIDCGLCAAPIGPEAFFCSRCGELARTPPPDAVVAGPWRAILAAEGEDRDTVFGAPAVLLPGDDPDDGVAPRAGDTAPAPDDLPELFEGDLDPPEGFRETAWFLDGEDPDALSAIENRDVPAEDRVERYRPENVVVTDDARRRLSLGGRDADGAEEDER